MTTLSFVAAGASSATNGSAPTPGLPAGLAIADLLIAVFYSRENVDGTVSISSGWAQLYNDRTSGGLLGVWYRQYQSGDAAPTFTLGGHATGNSGDSAIAQICAFRGEDRTDEIDVSGAVSTNASAQNIGAISGITLAANDAVVVIGGKRDDWTSVATLSGDSLTWAEVGEPDTTSGADAGLVWDYAIDGGSGATVTAKTFAVTGGASADGKGVMFSINVAVTQTLSGVGAIATGESFGSAKLNLQVSGAGAIASGQAFGPDQVNFTILAAGNIGGAEAFGATTVAQAGGGQTVSAAGAIGTAESFGAQQLNLRLSNAGNVDGAESFGTQQVNLRVSGAGAVASSEVFGSDKISFSILNAGGIAAAGTFGAPSLSFILRNVGAVVTAEGFGATTLVQPGGAQTISNAGAIASAEGFGVGVVSQPASTEEMAGPWRLLTGEYLPVTTRRLVPEVAPPVALPPAQFIAGVGGIESAERFGFNYLRVPIQISAGGIAGAEGFGAPSLGFILRTKSAEYFGETNALLPRPPRLRHAEERALLGLAS